MGKVREILRRIQLAAISARFGRCPFCGPSVILRLFDDETGIRCVRCRASAVHLSLGWAMEPWKAKLAHWRVYELSSRGALVNWLRRWSLELTLSEYFDDVPRGTVRDGIRCEDVQHLSFADESFDLVTHTEVFEHVPDDRRGFRELARVLRAGGVMVFSVPLNPGAATLERARLHGGGIEHLLPPTYHSDRLRGSGRVLCFRDYGFDIVDRLNDAGFEATVLHPVDSRVPWNAGRVVVTARKPRRPVE